MKSYARQLNYIFYGAVLGAVAVPAAGVFLAEYYYDYSTVMRVSLDIAVGIMGIPVGVGVGGLCGLIISTLRNMADK